ncbi:Chromatin assembly factor 1 subunit B [Operophtera brumata]|uniref:Chromatin assembly factor 1 subunit B n=1 Tax=Operophtera brumata TaxID=104452 RepID=A0A0L7L8G5_OPEBR|nr:Chromatin assembly factor 1 subunit B [Operophtera brumata]
MKFAIPEISWHNRDPVLSVDFQPKTVENGPLRLATGGTDSHVLIWYVSATETGSVSLEVAADLARHQKAVNVVRWAPSGQLLASGDDESIIFIWKQKTEKESIPAQNLEGEEQYKEAWVIHKTLRGHMEDVLDVSWSANSLQLASGSVDNKLLLWDVSKGKYSCILSDHKGFVQGVAWDPKGQYVATASTDRTFRTFDLTTKKVVSRSSKAILPFPAGHSLHGARVRLYHDDTLQTYYRRLQFSPDGLLVAVPAGRVEPEQMKVEGKPINAVYIYTRYSLKPALVTRWSPRRYRLRAAGPRAALPAPYRMLLAVGTRRALLLYDTQQRTPIALISNIHYTRLTDLTWSSDGCTLVASSTDGYCSVVSFGPTELGEPLPDDSPPDNLTTFYSTETVEVPAEVPVDAAKEPEATPAPKEKTESKSTTPKIDSFIKFKAPAKSPKKKSAPQPKTPVKFDLEEMAMPSWSDNSNNDIIRPKESEQMDIDPDIMIIEDSEDMKLVYEETQAPKSAEPSPKDSSPEQSSTTSENTFFRQAKVTDVKTMPVKSVPSPKAPRRVNFVTLSSPKNKKKV